MGSSLFHPGSADARPDEKDAEASEPRAPRSLLASPWFWIGGLVSMAIWAALYAAFTH